MNRDGRLAVLRALALVGTLFALPLASCDDSSPAKLQQARAPEENEASPEPRLQIRGAVLRGGVAVAPGTRLNVGIVSQKAPIAGIAGWSDDEQTTLAKGEGSFTRSLRVGEGQVIRQWVVGSPGTELEFAL